MANDDKAVNDPDGQGTDPKEVAGKSMADDAGKRRGEQGDATGGRSYEEGQAAGDATAGESAPRHERRDEQD